MNIDELQPGPELNQLIAEEIMGWAVRGKDSKSGPRTAHRFVEKAALDSVYPRMWLGADGLLTGWALDEWPEGTFDEHSPHYAGDAPALFTPNGVFRPSVDWAAAGLVIERLANLRDFLSWELRYATHAEFHFSVLYAAPIITRSANAETAPLAVCRAALKVIASIDKT